MPPHPGDIARRRALVALSEFYRPVLEPTEKISVEWVEVSTGDIVSFDEVVVPVLESTIPGFAARSNPTDPWYWLLVMAVGTERGRVQREAREAGEPDPLVGFSIPSTGTATRRLPIRMKVSSKHQTPASHKRAVSPKKGSTK